MRACVLRTRLRLCTRLCVCTRTVDNCVAIAHAGGIEAIIGALYLDQEIDGVRKFLIPFLEIAAEDILIHRKDEDPKSMLQEWAQGKGYPAPVYMTRSISGPDHLKLFEVDVLVNNKVSGAGSGSSKQAATKQAAIDAIDKLHITDWKSNTR